MNKDSSNNKRILDQSEKGDKGFASEYNVYILNDLEYSEASKNDKRSFFEYYLSLLKEKHTLLFSFCRKNDYNSRIIKILLFIYLFFYYIFICEYFVF